MVGGILKAVMYQPKMGIVKLESWERGQKYFSFLIRGRIMGIDQLTFV